MLTYFLELNTRVNFNLIFVIVTNGHMSFSAIKKP